MTRFGFVIGVGALVLIGSVFFFAERHVSRSDLAGGFGFTASVPLGITDETPKGNSKNDVVTTSLTYEETLSKETKPEVIPKEKEPEPIPCTFETTTPPKREKLIVNEVAWMGGQKSANDEWIELKNLGKEKLPLSGWQLRDEESGIAITFGEDDVMLGNGFYLLERTDDTAVSPTADKIYTGALGNVNEGLYLFSSSCVLEDAVFAHPAWAAGDPDMRKSMERDEEGLGWHTSLYVGGTPKARNSDPAPFGPLPPPLEDPEPDEAQSPPPPPPSQPTPPPPVSPPPPVTPPSSSSGNTNEINHLVISEVQITGGTGHTTDDFIELFNPTGVPINLKGYRLVKRSTSASTDTLIKSWTTETLIPAYGFYLWANSAYINIAVTPDVATSGSIADNNGIALRLGANDTGDIIDSVGWGEITNSFGEGSVLSGGLTAFQSYERKAWHGACITASVSIGNGCDTDVNASDFDIRGASDPQNSTSALEL